MREVHRGLPARDFKRPASGVTQLRVCAKSGQLLTSRCKDGSVVLTFLSNSTPSEYCTYHGEGGINPNFNIGLDAYDAWSNWQPPTLDLDSLPSEAWFNEGEETAPLNGAGGAAYPSEPLNYGMPAGGAPAYGGTQSTGGLPALDLPAGLDGLGAARTPPANQAENLPQAAGAGLDGFQLPDYDPLTE
jgi:hypothetical protein